MRQRRGGQAVQIEMFCLGSVPFAERKIEGQVSHFKRGGIDVASLKLMLKICAMAFDDSKDFSCISAQCLQMS